MHIHQLKAKNPVSIHVTTIVSGSRVIYLEMFSLVIHATLHIFVNSHALQSGKIDGLAQSSELNTS